MMRLRILSLALGAGLAGGCATLAPEHERPAPSVPDAFPQAGALPEGQPAATIPWRDYFTDPRLREVIAQALENNRDLRVAAFNIEKARAQYRIRSADRFPAVGADGSQTVQRLPGDLTTTGETMTQRQYSATLGFAAWELDFFGRIRNLSEQSVEQYLATEEARRSLRISLIAEVAQAWMTLAADRERLALARSTYETREKSYDLTRRSFELGAVSALDLRQSETLLAGVPLRAEWLPETLGEPTAAVAEMTAGVPSEVLARRPDILQAEHELRAANASIGAARAAFFPSIALTAGGGTASSSLDGLFASGSGTWTFMPQVRLPIFEAGRLQASLDVAELQRDIGIARYQKAVQTAFREVADTLAERATLGERLGANRRLVESAGEGFRLSEARYTAGVDSYLGLLDAQRALYGAELQLIDVRLAEAVNRVVLYKVLGGGAL